MLGNVSIYHSILQSNKGRPGYSGGNAIFKFTPIEDECFEFKYQPIFFTVESTRIESWSLPPMISLQLLLAFSFTSTRA